MIRVLVAEDSPTVRAALVELLQSDREIVVVGEAESGAAAVAMTERLRPDIVTMDIVMPGMDGVEATRHIMSSTPTPILIVSATVGSEVTRSLDATAAGALMMLEKPDHASSAAFPAQRERLLTMVKAMSQVKVVRRWSRTPVGPTLPFDNAQPDEPARVVAIAASTGGPAALLRILGALAGDLPVPVLIVQHITQGFVHGLAEWLGRACDIRVKVAVHGEPLRRATVYLAPDDCHLGVGAFSRVQLSDAPPIGGFRPSATHLFESVAKSYGPGAACVILTGMGSDGVAGLRAVRAAGGRVVAQDEQTSVVYGMPGEAVRAGVVHRILPVDRVAMHVTDLVTMKEGQA